MFDNLREQANASPFYEEEAQFQSAETPEATAAPRTPGHFLGMTPMQRFIISVMLMIMVCTIGAMVLLITGKFGLL